MLNEKANVNVDAMESETYTDSRRGFGTRKIIDWSIGIFRVASNSNSSPRTRISNKE